MTHVAALIVTALPEEFDAAKSVGLATAPGRPGIANWREGDTDELAPYLIGDYVTADGRRLPIALARPTRMGGRSTGPIATSLTLALEPTCLAMSGVCAGNPDATAPGDVVVAETAYEYDEGRLSESTFDGDHRQYPQDARWLRAAQEFDPADTPSYGTATENEAALWFLERLYQRQNPRTHPARKRYFPRGTWQPRLQRLTSDGLIESRVDGWDLTAGGMTLIRQTLQDDVDGPDRLPFAVHTGPMASGSAVVKDPAIWQRIQAMGVRKIIALEMEAATIATIAHERRVPHWLVVKGVMDRADHTKDDRFKEFAARASAEVLYRLLARLLPTVDPWQGAAAPQPTMAGAAAVRFPGRVKVQIVRELHFDWQDLADLFGVPRFVRVRFRAGDEPRELWEWLESRGKLPELSQALDEIGRQDLSRMLRSVPPDRP